MPPPRNPPPRPPPAIRPANQQLSAISLLMAVALVIARACMLEYFRDPFEATPGAEPIPRGAGITSSLIFDALCWIPLLLVLMRAAFDRAFKLRFSWAHALFVILGALALSSTSWANDRFAAAVGGFHLLSAAL